MGQPTEMKHEFEKRKPWITKFVIEGKEYGGSYDAVNDNRIKQFWQFFPTTESVLELSSLEGGHAFALARSAKKVIGIEARQANVDKGRFCQHLLGISNVEFINADLEGFDLSTLGVFDAVFCVGILYHLQKPWELISQISKVTTNIFIWTHYSAEANANEVRNAYRGKSYSEHGLSDPLSGMSATSFWLSRTSLLKLLGDNGFRNVQIIEDDPNHKNGPCITLAAFKKAK